MENIYMISYPFKHKIISFDPTRYYVRKRLENLINRQKYLSYLNIVADKGYGKSSFIYSYIARKNFPTIWVDSSDLFPEASVFLENIAQGAALLTHSEIPVPEDNLQEYIMCTFFDLDSPMYLVIDHFQLICHDEKILGFLNRIFSLNIPWLTVVTLSTEQPDISMTKLKAKGRYLELSTQDLTFTYDEIAKFFIQYHDLPLEKYELDLIYKETRGWITGCQLILVHLQQNYSDENTSLRLNYLQSLPDIYDYINNEIFTKETEELRSFMTLTSLLTELDPIVINQYLNINNAQEMIHILHSHNCCISKTKSGVYEYSHLFRFFLYEQYYHTNPEDILNRHLKLSYIFEENHLFLDAFVHAAASRNYIRSAEIMHIISLRYNSYQILHIIDEKLDEISPLLVLPDTTLFLNRCISEEMMKDFIPPLEASLNQALQSRNLLTAVTLQHRLSAIYYHLGEVKKCYAMLNETLSNAQAMKDYPLIAFSLQLLADCCFEMQEYTASMTHAKQALFLTEKYHIRTMQIHCLEVFSRLQTDPEQASSYIKQALSLTAPNSYSIFWLYAAKSSLLKTSIPQESILWARKAVARLSPYCCGYDLAYTNRILGEALLACGNYQEADECLTTAYQNSVLCGLERLHVLEAQLELAKKSRQAELAKKIQEELSSHCIKYNYTWFKTPHTVQAISADDIPILHICTLGRFSVLCEGKTVSFKRASSLRIFQFLITNRNIEKNRDIIAEEIFSNIERDYINHFHVAMSSLRKDLNTQKFPKGGSPYLIRNRDRYQLNAEYICLDADDFIEMSTCKCETQKEHIARLLKAVDLYKGDYLEEYPYEYYLQAEREKLKKLQIKNLYEIAEYYRGNREPAQAASYYEKIIQTDPYEEQAYLECYRIMLQINAVSHAREIADKMISYIERDLGVPCRNRLEEIFHMYTIK